MKAKFLSVLLALTMVLSLLHTAALAVDKTVSTEEELKQAIESVSDGDTITVSGTIEVNAPLVVKNTVTLTGGSIVASDTFSSTSGDFTKYNLISLQTPEKTLTLKDIMLDAKGKTLAVYCNAGKVVVDGATITGGKTSSYVAGVYMTSASQFEMNSGSITGNEVGDSYKNDHYTQYASDLWIGANANGALTSINGGKIGNIFVNSNEWSEKNPGSFTMNGGSVDNIYVEYDKGHGATFTYSNGTIDHLYLSTINGNGGCIEVTPVAGTSYKGGVPENPVARIGGSYYATLAGAIAAAKSGDTVTLVKDSSEAVTITEKITLTAAKDVTFSGSLTFEPDSEGSEVDGVRFENNGARKVADIVTIKAPNITVQNCKFTVPSAVWAYKAQPNCIKIQGTSGAVIDNNTFYLGRIQDSSGSNPTVPVNGHSNVAINVVGPNVTKVTICNNHLYATEPSTSLAVGNTNEATERLSASVNMIIAIGNGNSAYGIGGLTIQGNTVDGSNDSVNTRFAGLSNVNAFVIEKNSILNAGVGTYQVHYQEKTFKNNPESISGNTYTGMTSDISITLASAARKSGDTWTDYNSVQDAVSAVQPGDKVIDRHSADKVTVTLKYNEDSDNDAEISVVKDTDITLPTPTRSGRYTFLYWTDGTDTYDAGDTYTVTGSATLNAVWRHIGSGSSSSSGSSISVGSPAVKSTVNPFTDVTASDYYYNAVLWAVENGITTGTSETTFSPNESCTRAQCVTFLYRAVGSAATAKASFTDVSADAYYAPAVDWAVEKGVTTGTSATTFSPDDACTRAQIVTFLYRAAQVK